MDNYACDSEQSISAHYVMHPPSEDVFFSEKVEIPTFKLQELISNVNHVKDRDDSFPYMQGIHIHSDIDRGSLRSAKTNGNELAVFDTGIKDTIKKDKGITLPIRAVNQILKLIRIAGADTMDLPNRDPVKIFTTDSVAHFKIGEYYLTTYLHTYYPFPDYKKIVYFDPSSSMDIVPSTVHKITFERHSLIASLHRLHDTQKRKLRKATHHFTEFKFGNLYVELTAMNCPGVGIQNHDKMYCTSGKELKVVLNTDDIIRVLENFKADEVNMLVDITATWDREDHNDLLGVTIYESDIYVKMSNHQFHMLPVCAPWAGGKNTSVKIPDLKELAKQKRQGK